MRFVEHFLRKNIDYISEENAYQHELHDKVFCQKMTHFVFSEENLFWKYAGMYLAWAYDIE